MGDATTNRIKGGYVAIARKIEESTLWQKKKAEWAKVFLHILLNVNYTDNETSDLPRGSGLFNWAISQAKLHGVSTDQYQRCIEWMREANMIETARTTRGLIIKVLNYDQYQDPENYLSPQNSRPTKKKAKQAELSLPGEPLPVPAKPKALASWVIPYIELWRNIFHAEPAAGHLMKYLGALHQRHGQPKTLQHLENYLRSCNPHHINLSKFEQTFGSWAMARQQNQPTRVKADYQGEGY